MKSQSTLYFVLIESVQLETEDLNFLSNLYFDFEEYQLGLFYFTIFSIN